MNSGVSALYAGQQNTRYSAFAPVWASPFAAPISEDSKLTRRSIVFTQSVSGAKFPALMQVHAVGGPNALPAPDIYGIRFTQASLLPVSHVFHALHTCGAEAGIARAPFREVRDDAFR